MKTSWSDSIFRGVQWDVQKEWRNKCGDVLENKSLHMYLMYFYMQFHDLIGALYHDNLILVFILFDDVQIFVRGISDSNF